MCSRHHVPGNAQSGQAQSFEKRPGNAGTAPHRRLNTHLSKEMHPTYGRTHSRATHRCAGVCVRAVTAVSQTCLRIPRTLATRRGLTETTLQEAVNSKTANLVGVLPAPARPALRRPGIIQISLSLSLSRSLSLSLSVCLSVSLSLSRPLSRYLSLSRARALSLSF